MALLFLVLLLVVQVEEFTFLMLPVVFGLVSPAVILKELLNSSRVHVGDRSVILEKRFGKKVEIDLVDIKVVVGLVSKGRIVILILSKDPSKIIAISDWFPMDQKKTLLSSLKRMDETFQFGYKEFKNKQAAMVYLKSFYK